MGSPYINHKLIFCIFLALSWHIVLSQNIIKDPTPTAAGLADLAAKINDLRSDGSHYGLGYNYLGSPVLGLNYGQHIVAAPYTPKPYLQSTLTGAYPQGYSIPGKSIVPYNGYYIYPGYGPSTNYAIGSGIGLGYPGVLGYNSGYDQHGVLPPHGYNGVQFPGGYLG